MITWGSSELAKLLLPVGLAPSEHRKKDNMQKQPIQKIHTIAFDKLESIISSGLNGIFFREL